MHRSSPIVLAMALMGLVACSDDTSNPDYWNQSGGAGGGAAGGGAAGGGAAGGGAAGGGATGGAPGGGGSSTSGTCSLEVQGATGGEPAGMIPVCCAPTASEKAQIDEVFQLLNAHRQAKGVAPLAYDGQLEATIQGHCLHMNEHPFFDHDAPEGPVSSPWTRAELCGTSAGGENIANGQSSPSAVMASWTSSSGHNANMLDPDFKRVGIGRSGSYWGQIFGR